jgi:hypothetical protein
MSIIGVFNSEKEMYEQFPKVKYFKMQNIFQDYWDMFLEWSDKKNIKIRPVVKRDVERMIICKTPHLGSSTYHCPKCNNTLQVYNTCKSRFCNSCGIKYAKQRSLNIESKLIDCPHRHLVFTISDKLWPLFLEDRKRLNFMFEAVNITISSWFKEKYKKECYKPGFILALHTFGRDDKWNVHIHCLYSEIALGNNGSKKFDFIPFDMLRKRFQKVLLDLLEKDIGKEKFRKLKNWIYQTSHNGFYVRAKKNEFPNSKKAISYILRYCGRPCFAQYRIIDIDDNDFITFWYQRHEDDKFVVEKIHIFEWIARLIRHIPDRNFKTIRYYGIYASREHKLYNTCRLLIDKAKLPFYKSLNNWRNLLIITFNKDPLKCPNCGSIMKFEYGFT